MIIQSTDTVDQVVCESLSAAMVLSKHGIDFCSEGTKTLKEACAEAGVSLKKLIREVHHAAMLSRSDVVDPSSMAIDDLTLYIENYHHNFAVENIVFIKTSLHRLVLLYGNQYPELIEIRDTFEALTGPLMIHMQHEEFIVFPYIRQLVKTGKRVNSAMYRSVNSPIPGMLTDHDKGETYLRRLDELTHHYQAPPEKSTAFRVTYAAMRALERNLQAHITLESEVLFPKALEMEIRVNNLTWPSLPVA